VQAGRALVPEEVAAIGELRPALAAADIVVDDEQGS
jgi:hypothetical protein